MTVDKDHEDRVKSALKEHDTNFLYQFIFNEETPGDKDSVVSFGVALAFEENDDEVIDKIMLALVHSSVNPVVLAREIYKQGFEAGMHWAETEQSQKPGPASDSPVGEVK